MSNNGFVLAEIIFSSTAFLALLKIIAIDIILSGDNAIVIAMATRKLSKKQQNKALFWGIFGAVLLRILFAMIIVQLLQIPFMHIIGGLLLLWIAYRVLVGNENAENPISAQNSLFKAIGTIILADAVMSLDNVVAIAAAADGHLLVLAIGVAISIPVMIFASKIIVKIMDKYPWISYLGSAILAWVAGEMLMKDQYIHITGLLEYIVLILLVCIVLSAGYITNRKRRMKEKSR